MCLQNFPVILVSLFFHNHARMARRMFRSRRRLGGGRGSYAGTMGLRPVPFTRKRKFPGTGATPRLGRRVRPKLARSYVLTKTQKKRRSGRVISHGDNQSASVTRIGKPYMSRFDKNIYRKVISPQSIFGNFSSQVSSSTGQQNLFQIPMMDLSMLTSIETATAGGATVVPTKFFLKQAKMVLRFRNQTNTVARCSIYDLYAKKSSPATTIATPLSAWSKGLADYGLASDAYKTIGFTPFRSPEFNQYFGVKRVTSVFLEAGQQHDHTVYYNYNRIVDSIQFQNQVGSLVAGLTRHIMVVYHGTLMHQTDAPSVSYASIGMDFSYHWEYSYGFLEKTTRTFGGTNTIPTAIADPDMMGEGGDADVNVIRS